MGMTRHRWVLVLIGLALAGQSVGGLTAHAGGRPDAPAAPSEVRPPSDGAYPPGLSSGSPARAGSSETARVVEGQLTSELLGAVKPYLVYLPPGYGNDTRRYPVLYMLHGMGGNYQEWQDQGLFAKAADMMTDGEIPAYIIVTPQGDQSYWLNWVNGGPQYGDYVVREVVPHIDAKFRTLTSPSARAVGGLSMGGTGALQMAFNHPEIFGIAGGHSPTLRTEETALDYMGQGSYFRSQDPVSLARSSPGAAQVRIWLDVGDQDEWRSRVDELHEALLERGIGHEYHNFPGQHESEYWMAWEHLYLQFYGRAFAG